MKYGSKEYNDILKQFTSGRSWLNDVVVDIEGGENEIDPLTLLRAYDEEPSIESSLSLTSQFILNKKVVFYRKDQEVFALDYAGGNLSEKFTKVPYLLDTLMKLCQGLMLKKLTPPSEDSGVEEQR